jgi:hypothetical protein
VYGRKIGAIRAVKLRRATKFRAAAEFALALDMAEWDDILICVRGQLKSLRNEEREMSIANLARSISEGDGVGAITLKTAHAFGKTPRQIMEGEQADVGEARQVAMAAVRILTRTKLRDIGAAFGGRSESTAYAAVRKYGCRIERLLSERGRAAA